jgi:hypothetical protein
MFVQLILTIGKARTFDSYNPLPFLTVFDYEKIAFLQYNAVHDVFYLKGKWRVVEKRLTFLLKCLIFTLSSRGVKAHRKTPFSGYSVASVFSYKNLTSPP